MKKSHWIIIILVALFFIAYSYRPEIDFATVRVEKPDVWPTEEWPESTPEEQGVDSEKLAEMFEHIEKTNPYRFDGLLIIKNGHIITEKYNFPYDEDFPHQIYSVTKSLTSAATGVAIDEGLFSLDDNVLDFFPDMSFENMSEAKENMTVEHLLTMTNGMDWNEFDDPELWVDWRRSDEQLKFYLDNPVIKEKVGKFNYDTGASFTMGAIIEKATGQSLADYAQEKIFNKIGVTSMKWHETNDGYTHGGTFASMTPRDMARFGFLYLHRGEWDGEQIVPKDWVKASTTPQTGEVWDGYGYYFWLLKVKDKEIYQASGANHQNIFIVPDENLVVVYSASGKYVEGLLTYYIFPAIKSDKAIPANEEAYARLKELMED
ncbi:serine hydrolase domain-containing protein [Ornithinibacillus californiensis]|uniref:serine hydrolase domain-containing protein n=1 Tax=Ornithinibacillus californiensis TaxID=161536 RepID=UPI00064D7A10|nr:serine hydrolase [Ornithinibacillus californiensis]